MRANMLASSKVLPAMQPRDCGDRTQVGPATPSAHDTWTCKLAYGCAAYEPEPFCCYWFEQGHAQHAGVEALSYLTRNGLVCMLTRSAILYLPSSSMVVTGTLWLQQLHVLLLQRGHDNP
jgi:hypothetical protein